MHAPVKGLSVLAVTGMAVLMVFVLVAGSVAAAPTPTTSTSVGSWSYGVVKTVSVASQHTADGWTYQGNATFGYTTTIYENNTSATTFEVTILRTMGAAFSVQFCFPSCTSPTEWFNESYRAWEATTAFSNFTTQGSVLESASSVPAIAILNSTVFLRANLTESSDVYLPRAGQLGPHTGYLAATIAGDSIVNFSPALGLIPTVLTPGRSWSSTGNFNESGAAERSFYYAAHSPLKNTTFGPVSDAVSFTNSGPISIQGSYPVDSAVQISGVKYPAITITVVGPFSVREGVIFVPSSADLFGSSAQPWAGEENGTATAQLSTLDLKASEGDHLGLVASSWRFDSGSVNAADSAQAVSGTSGLTMAVAASNPVSTETLQGEPETEAQSVSSQQCLTSGSGCPSAVGASSPRSWLGVVVVVGAIATIAALLAFAVVSRRRQIPPPTYPNAVLYPPGAASPPAPAGAPAKPGTPPPAEDDPLDHLW
ncbi:MAG: hypothetical protein ABSA63_08150 [Thermoplasmata archaeon]|jgi:hypothetical protein